MNTNIDFALPSSTRSTTSAGTDEALKGSHGLRLFFLLLGATLATMVSLAIAAYSGWQRGGIPVERVMNVSLCCVAVLYVHWLPVVWRSLGVAARVCAFVVWWVACAVVLFGQVSFFMLSQQHAGDQRAALVAMPQAVPGAILQAGRTRTQIALDIAATKATLAQLDARRCIGNCTTLTVRRQTLAARLAALNTEDSEALRREADQDRKYKRADRADVLRELSRTDPVALAVATRFHTTENLFALIVAVACAVVLEGSAILGWLLVSIAGGRADGRDVVVSGRSAIVTGREEAVATCAEVVSQCDVAIVEQHAIEEARLTVAAQSDDDCDDSDVVTAADERRLEKIRHAVLAGTLDPTQESIRKFLRCGQPKAGRLNRLYQDRFGGRARQDADAMQECLSDGAVLSLANAQ